MSVVNALNSLALHHTQRTEGEELIELFINNVHMWSISTQSTFHLFSRKSELLSLSFRSISHDCPELLVFMSYILRFERKKWHMFTEGTT